MYAQRRERSFRKNNERKHVREMRLMRLSARLPQTRLMAKARARLMARARVKVRTKIMARMMINWLLKPLRRLSIRCFGTLMIKKMIG